MSSNNNNNNANTAHQARSVSMISLHYHGQGKKSVEEDPKNNRIPFQVYIPDSLQNSRIVFHNDHNNAETNRPQHPVPGTKQVDGETVEQTNTRRRKRRMVLIVVGKTASATTYSRQAFPDFEDNLKNTLELCRTKHHNTTMEIIHINSSSASSQRPSAPGVHDPQISVAPSSSSSSSSEARSCFSHPHPTRRFTSSSAPPPVSVAASSPPRQHPRVQFMVDSSTVCTTTNSTSSTTPTNHEEIRRSLRPNATELVIPSPAWSNSCHILLRNELQRIANARTNKQQPLTLLVCGVNTSVNVLHAVKFCREELGYDQTYLLEDVCADRTRLLHDQALALHENQLFHQHEQVSKNQHHKEGRLSLPPPLHTILTSYRHIFQTKHTNTATTTATITATTIEKTTSSMNAVQQNFDVLRI